MALTPIQILLLCSWVLLILIIGLIAWYSSISPGDF